MQRWVTGAEPAHSLCSTRLSRDAVALELMKTILSVTVSLFLVLPSFRATFADELLPADQPIPTVIDHYIDLALVDTEVIPSAPATDANMARRLYLDLVGRIPSMAEAQSFVAAADDSKKQQLIDRLIVSPGFIRHQANEFDAMLMNGKGSIRDYLLTAFREHRRWDEMFRELILGESADVEQKGAIQFVRSRAQDLDKLTNETSVMFFGVNVSCAKCHDHPLVDAWTQNHFYGMKSFFSRTFDNGGLIGERDYGLVSFTTTAGESRQASMLFLNGTEVEEPAPKEPSDEEKKQESQRLEELKKNKQPPPPPEFSRRAQLVRVALESQSNNYFAKAIVNKTWNRFFGSGIVMPIDQMHPENEPSHPQLLEWLARDLINNGYDLTRLTRGILLSNAYARTSMWEGEQPPEPSLFAVALPRPLTPFQYATTLRFGSRNPETFASDLSVEDHEKRVEAVETSARGLATLFEQPYDAFQISVSEALLLSNGDRAENELLREDADSLVNKLKVLTDRHQIIETAIWSILSRAPTADEFLMFDQYLAARENQPVQRCQQIIWILLTSSENRFNY